MKKLKYTLGVMLVVLSYTTSYPALVVGAALFGLGFSGIMPNYPLAIRALFPVWQLGWRVASQYMFAAMGMALGGWLGGAIFDLTGSYSNAFLVGVLFNLMNLALVGALWLRHQRFSTGLQPAV